MRSWPVYPSLAIPALAIFKRVFTDLLADLGKELFKIDEDKDGKLKMNNY